MWSQTHPFAIVLCTYNGARFLEEQLQSLRVQAGVAEIVVADDGSTDGTMAILQRHAAEDPRIRLTRNPRTLGVTANFERGISLARSPWIALADQDDIWLPGKLAQLRACWDGEACLVHHATRKFRDAVPMRLPSPAGERRKFSGSDARRLLYRNTVVGHTVVVRAGLVRRLTPFPREVPHDWWIGTGAALLGRVQYVDEYLVHYRIHTQNAYHTAGSRWRRAGSEHGLRLELLRALATHPAPEPAAADFARTYRRELEATQAGTFPWKLWRFYHRHSAVLFGNGGRLPPFRRLRKSFQAALGAMLRPAVTRPGELHRPVRPAGTPAVQPMRRTG